MITDYLMPGMNGAELIEHAHQLSPAMRVMLITGYSNVAESPAASVPRLAKPFRQADLAEMVAQLLEREPAGGEVVKFPGQTG
jgi:DNA-binding NtrC family response regulator